MFSAKALLASSSDQLVRLFKRDNQNNYSERFEQIKTLYRVQRTWQQIYDSNQSKNKALTVAIVEGQNDALRLQNLFYRKLNQQIRHLLNFITLTLEQLLIQIPNIPHQSVPLGTKSANQVVEQCLDYPNQPFQEIKTRVFERHDKILQMLNLLETPQTVKMVGPRFVTYQGLASQLLRALENYLLNYHFQNGYLEVTPPYLIKQGAMEKTGQLPKSATDSYQVTDSHLYLLPTAEVALLNLYANKHFTLAQIPYKVCAYSPCFRKEAGAAGQSTAGVVRLHQFHKVEVVQFVEARKSYDQLQTMTTELAGILKIFKIPYQIVNLASEDLAFQAAKTLDLEVWWPSQKKFLEISSISNTEAFQTLPLKIQLKTGTTKVLLHALNGSGLALDRLLAVLVEYCFVNETKTFVWPKVLLPYLPSFRV